MKKRLTVLLICASMVLSLLTAVPVTVVADDTSPEAVGTESIYVSDLTPTYWEMYLSSSDNPASPYHPSYDCNEAGGTLNIAGVDYAKGMRTHPNNDTPAIFRYDISGLDLKYFTATVGKDSAGGYTNVQFRVVVDGETRAESSVLAPGQAEFISCSVEGGSVLELIVDPVDGCMGDSVGWGNALLTNVKPEEAPATEPETEPATEPETDPVPVDQPETLVLGEHTELLLEHSCLEDRFGINTAHDGDAITIGGVEFTNGFGMHCNPGRDDTWLEIDVSAYRYSYFTAYVGVQNYSSVGEFRDWGSIQFKVYGDGELLATTRVCKKDDAPVFIYCDITGIKTLKLVQDNADGHACDSGAWGDVILTNEKPDVEPEEETFSPDRTDELTPADIVSGDYAYASDMYWKDWATYGTNVIGRDVNTAEEWIFDSSMNIWEKGLGMHVTSTDYTSFIEIQIQDMGFKTFATYYGICMTAAGYDISMASVKFAVFGDGELLFESEEMNSGTPFEYMECNIEGVSTLRLAIAAVKTISGGWGTWGGAVLLKNGSGHDLLDPEEETEPATEPTTDPAAEPSTEPATNPATAEPATEPATAPEEPTAAETVPTAGTDANDTTPETTAASRGCRSAAAGAAVLALTVWAAACLCKKGRKQDEA